MDFFWPADDAAAVLQARFDKTNWQAGGGGRSPRSGHNGRRRPRGRVRYGECSELFAVRFSLDRMPEGPQTVEVCESLDDWAEEVDWVLDEELNTADH